MQKNFYTAVSSTGLRSDILQIVTHFALLCVNFLLNHRFHGDFVQKRGAKFVLSNRIVINKLFVNILSYVHNSVVKALQRVKKYVTIYKKKAVRFVIGR